MDVLWAALAGMLVYLDTTAVAQVMICQPLIVCPLWGLAAGQPEIGILFGIVFQLIWLGNLPVGAAKFPEGNVGALVATAIAVQTPPLAAGFNWSVLTAAALTGILTAHFGAEATLAVRKLLTSLAPQVVAAAVAGETARFARLFWGAIGLHAAAGFALTAAGYLLGLEIILPLWSKLFAAGSAPLAGLWPGLLGVGAAVIISRFVRRGTRTWFGTALGVGLAAGALWL